jgi:putative peptidoglycan lipid II flippase
VSSRILGLVREQVIAALFGATGSTSAFRTATRVSTAAYDLLLAGAITSALVPVFTEYSAPGRSRDLSRIVSSLTNLTILTIGGIVAVLMLIAPLIISVLGADVEYSDLAVQLTRLALPSVALLGISGILTALLQSRHAFARPAFASATYNGGIILAALVLAAPMGIRGLALGLLVGAALQVLFQLPAWKGLRYEPVIDLTNPGVRLALRLYAPVFLGMLASYGVVIVDTNLAWRTGPDSVAAMGFATTLIQFPIGLVGVATSLAILPSLSRLAGQDLEGDMDRYFAMLTQALKAVLLLIIPLTAALVVLREPIVAVLFQRAAFDATATERTALALLAYAPQLPFVVVDQLLIIAFYAQKRPLTPVLVGLAGATTYLALALALVGPLGMPGLALANAAQNSIHAVVLYVLLSRQTRELRSPELASVVGRLIIAAAVCGAAAILAASAVGPLLAGPGPIPRLLGLTVAAGAAFSAYSVALLVLGLGEGSYVPILLAELRARVGRNGKSS